MSGPKCFEVDVNWELLSQARQEAERTDMALLADLEKQLTCAGDDENLRQRMERLAARIQARQARAATRQERDALAAVQRLEQARAEYRDAEETWRQTLTGRGDLEARFPGIALPEIPSLPEPDLASEAAAIASLGRLRQTMNRYQAAQDQVIEAYQRRQAELASIRTWTASFASCGARPVEDVLAVLESGNQFVQELADQDKLRRILNAAQDVVLPLSAWQGSPLSQEFLAQMDLVLSANNPGLASVELERLRVLGKAEAARLAEVAQATRRREEERQRQLAERRAAAVAEQIARTLEDLGYQVSDIEETAFVQDGRLYAIDQAWPDHALCFDLDARKGPLRVTAVRVRGENASPDNIDARQEQGEDLRFDTAWCSKSGLGRLRETLARRGIDARFKQTHAPGEVLLDVVREGELGSTLKTWRKTRRSRGAAQGIKRARTHDK